LAGRSAEHEGLVLTLAYTGLPWGEVVALRVRDLDLLRKRAPSPRTLSSRASRYTSAPRQRAVARYRFAAKYEPSSPITSPVKTLL